MRRWQVAMVALMCLSAAMAAQETKEPRFSHEGIKGSIGFGKLENNLDGEREYVVGDVTSLSLGWGVNEHFTLWLSGLGIHHRKPDLRKDQGGFVAVEFGGQYKLQPDSPWQPYGKLGIGIYFIGKSGVIHSGGGLAAALGIDYFVNRNVGFGIELQVKNQGYSRQSEEIDGVEQVEQLDPHLDGGSTGVVLTLTIQ